MPGRFDTFVVFAEMRTGSNFLEENLNLYPDLACLGEVFNPFFVAYPNKNELWGVDQAARDADPVALLERIKEEPGLNGFRYFHDHHAGVLDHILDDPRCAKVILTRNPVDSYVSWKIAQATGQWKLTNATHHKAHLAQFDREEFEGHLSALQGFQIKLLNALQKSGQTAFYVAYEDIQDIEVMNGLARFLGSETALDSLSKKLKKQNPAPISAKVANFGEMETALAALDRFDLTRTPNFEPRRGPSVPSYIAAAEAPLLFLPLRSNPERSIKRWLAGIDGVAPRDLLYNFSQKSLRQWKRSKPGHRSFTVLRHPVARAYRAFKHRVEGVDQGAFLEIRKTLIRVYNVPLAPDGPDASWGEADERAAFLGFLDFLRMNLGGQTAVRVDASWASQAQALEGYGDFAAPDVLIREETMDHEFRHLAALVGVSAPAPEPEELPGLAALYGADIEAAVRDVYHRDYMTFGFGDYGG
ncbi:MAG: sulfotransferase family 2 domain-containing protein [Pseudomonadota bacterium]